MHIYEKYILKKLAESESARYKDLKLPKVESNLFVYHLKHLVRRGLVEKGTGGYNLTLSGDKYVDQFSFHEVDQRLQPKIASLIVLKNTRGECLVHARKRRPFLGKISFPYGKIHYGESVFDAAKRELEEKAGISARLDYRGDVYVRVLVGEEPSSHVLFHIFAGKVPPNYPVNDSAAGKCFWVKAGDKRINKQTTAPGFMEVLKLASGRKRFFKELTVELRD